MKAKKKRKTIVLLLFVFALCLTVALILFFHGRKPVDNIELGSVYMGYAEKYPQKNEDRYYIELRENGTFSLILDEPGYDTEDPTITFSQGTYEEKDGNYYFKYSKGGWVVFWDEQAVIDKRIIFYEGGKIDESGFLDGSTYEGIFQRENGTYILGRQNEAGTGYLENQYTQSTLYKADVDDIPDTLEEFRNQYKKDKRYINDYNE